MAACSGTDVQSVKKAIHQLQQDFERLYRENRVSDAANLYTKDAVMDMFDRKESLKGRAGALEGIKEYKACGIAKVTSKEVDFLYGGGDYVTQVATFSCLDNHDRPLGDGKDMVVYKKVDGKWYFHYDISNLDQPSVRGQIRSRMRRWVEMYEVGDITPLVEEMYTDDCKFCIQGKPMVVGQDALKAAFCDILFHPEARVELKLGDVVEVAPDVVVETNSSFLTFDKNNGRQWDLARYMIIWKKVDGKWKIHADMSNPVHDF